jgi:hypothetical protein
MVPGFAVVKNQQFKTARLELKGTLDKSGLGPHLQFSS